MSLLDFPAAGRLGLCLVRLRVVRFVLCLIVAATCGADRSSSSVSIIYSETLQSSKDTPHNAYYPSPYRDLRQRGTPQVAAHVNTLPQEGKPQWWSIPIHINSFNGKVPLHSPRLVNGSHLPIYIATRYSVFNHTFAWVCSLRYRCQSFFSSQSSSRPRGGTCTLDDVITKSRDTHMLAIAHVCQENGEL